MGNLAPSYPFTLVCPLCQGTLEFIPSQVVCRGCREEFGYVDGIPDLIRGGQFADVYDSDRSAYEVLANTHLVHHYLLPLFRRLLDRLPHRPRVLSLGCGIGIDVDLLAEVGFEIVGIDCGNRCNAWSQRTHQHRLYRANGKHLPFENNLFDMVYCGCVFPHVGVAGDSRQILPNYYEERLDIAREMARVVNPNGFILVSSPNRLFPLDIFHGRTAEHSYPYLNLPTNPFLLSAGDYRHMFQQVGCNVFRLLPVVGYWGFINLRKTWKGRLLAFPVHTIFRVVSTKAFRALRGSLLSPWLVGLARKRNVDYSRAWWM